MAMTSFERTAIFTVITSIEQQLQGLKTLLAASGNSAHAVAEPARKRSADDLTSIYTNEQEDQQMDQMLNAGAAEALVKEAESTMQREWEKARAALNANGHA